MKKIILSGVVAAITLLTSSPCQAQSWKNLFNKENISKVVDVIKQHTDSVNLTGTWNYQSSAVEFESDNLLMKAGGEAAEKVAEEKLNERLAKFGFLPGQMSFTFNADSTFTSTVGAKTLRGTYSYNHATKEIDLKYLRLLNVHAKVKCTPQSMELLYNSDKLLKLLTFISSKSNSMTLKKISSLADSYDGMMLGFKMAPANSSVRTSTATPAANK